jgi:hypothetical protein
MSGFFKWLAGVPSDAYVSLEISQARLFAAQFVKRMARQVLMTLTWVRRACTLIMIGAMAVSFSHQRDYLVALGATMFAAIVIPAIFDCLTFICVKVLATSAVVTSAKWVAGGALIFTVGGSGTLNFLPPGPMVLKWVFVGAMLGIPIAEVVASQIKPDFRKMAALEAMLDSTVEPAPAPVASAPVEPATQPEPVPVAEATESVAPTKPRRRRPARTTPGKGIKRAIAPVEPTLDAVVEPAEVVLAG